MLLATCIHLIPLALPIAAIVSVAFGDDRVRVIATPVDPARRTQHIETAFAIVCDRVAGQWSSGLD